MHVFICVGAYTRVTTLLLPYVAVFGPGHCPLLQRALHSGSTISTIPSALDIFKEFQFVTSVTREHIKGKDQCKGWGIGRSDQQKLNGQSVRLTLS